MNPPDEASYFRGCETIRNRATGSPEAVVVCLTSDTAVPMIETLIECMSSPWSRDVDAGRLDGVALQPDNPLKVGRSHLTSTTGKSANVDNRPAW